MKVKLIFFLLLLPILGYAGEVYVDGQSNDGHILQEEGVTLAQQPIISFEGAGVTAANSGSKTIVTIPGGGGGSGDITSVGDCASGACLDGTQGTTLTFNNAGGDATIIYDGSTFTFSKFITSSLTGAVTGIASGNALPALSNLASVAINTSLISDLAATDDLGTEAIYWRKLYLGSDISFEGATDDAYQTTLTAVDTTLSDKSINIPNASGTMAVSATAPATLSALGDIGVTVLKDLVTTAPLTGGTNDILVGTDADITIAITTGIADTNAVVINAADVADNDYAKFTATGLEGKSYSEVLGDIGAQAADADLTTYAGITPTANAQTLLGSTFAQMQASLSVDDLITLSGVAEGSVNLATFTGATIADNVTIKAALQALETAVEGKQASDADLTTWAGITPGANVGTFLATPSSANFLTAITDETGTGTVVGNNSPTFADDIQLGLAGATGILKLYSEQGVTDYTANLYPHTAMTSAASFYLPADEPAAQSFVSMSTGGVMSFVAPDAGTNIANDLEEEVTEGSLADSTIVSADIKDGAIVAADTSITPEHTKCIYWETPVATDDFKSVYIFKTAATITQVFCESDQTVNMTLQEDDGSPADIETTDFVCDATPPTQTANFEDTAMAAGSRLDFDVTSVSGTPTWCSMCFSFTEADQ